MKITDIAGEKKEKQIQRLAAYCRVSSDSEDQLHSFAAQVRYYANYEKQHPDVELVGIYADEGLSGTSMKNRTELQRLIQDCEHGKIDRVITKSVSRFARNTHDLLQTVRLLKSLGVTVLFEEQGIDTAKLNSEMFLTFPGMIAQQESESISGNMRWSYKKRMESGEFNCCTPAYGFDMVDGELVINEKEAGVVRRIFNMYLHGIGKQRIADILNEEAVPKKYGKKKWHHTMISYILSNERYVGDALLQKNYTTDVLPFKRVINKGEKPKYYIENAGPSIIPKETFYAAKAFSQKKKCFRRSNAEHCLSQMLICPKCGKAFRRLDNGDKHYWIASTSEKRNCDCINYRLKEEGVYEAFCIMIYKLKENAGELIGDLLNQLKKIKSYYNNGEDIIGKIDKEIAQFCAQKHVVSKLHNNGILSSAEYAEQSLVIDNKIAELRAKRRSQLSENQDDELIDELTALKTVIDQCHQTPEFDIDLFEHIIKRIIVIDNSTVKYQLLGDVEFTERINKKMRCFNRGKKNNPVRI